MGFVVAVLFLVVVVLGEFRCCSVFLVGRGARWIIVVAMLFWEVVC